MIMKNLAKIWYKSKQRFFYLECDWLCLSKNHARVFKILAEEVEISYPQFKKDIVSSCELLPILLEEVMNSFENKIGITILNNVKKNCYKN